MFDSSYELVYSRCFLFYISRIFPFSLCNVYEMDTYIIF